MAKRLFTSESVTEGHPDKICDQISDAVLDAILEKDPNGRVACETLVTTGQVHVVGEVSTHCYVDIPKIIRETVREIGYTRAKYGFDADTCGILVSLDEQSPDIAQGVDKALEAREGDMDIEDAIGAGDQGMMFGYATNETENYMPLTLDLAHTILRELSAIRREHKEMTYLRPDSKSQVTVEYDEHNHPVRVHTIVVSTQHDDFIAAGDSSKAAQDKADSEMLATIYNDVKTILLPRVIAKLPERIRAMFDDRLILHVNPTGKFVIGGPHGDTGLTGRKIIVDTYGGRGAHGGGAFSGKDPSKVDRSAAYAARHIAKNIVAAGVADEALVQVAYAIGVAEPVSLCVNTNGTAKVSLTDAEISEQVSKIFDMRPAAIERRLKLRQPIYQETAAYGHMGRKNEVVKKSFTSRYHETKTIDVELFTWEKLDQVEKLKEAFGL